MTDSPPFMFVAKSLQTGRVVFTDSSVALQEVVGCEGTLIHRFTSNTSRLHILERLSGERGVLLSLRSPEGDIFAIDTVQHSDARLLIMPTTDFGDVSIHLFASKHLFMSSCEQSNLLLLAEAASTRIT